jgi:hypothetical protein
MKTYSKLLGTILVLGSLIACASPTPAPTPIPTVTPTVAVVQEDNSLHLGNWHDMFYSETLEQVILVNGGPESGKPGADPLELWAWNGRQWSLLSADPQGPRWRNFASITYDTNRDVLVLYGGLSEERNYTDTWEWDGENWTQFPVEGPGAREAAGMTFDASRNKVVLFGGAQSGHTMSDIWEWDGIQWTQIPADDGPDARFPAGFAYDAVNQNVLLFGGHSIDDDKVTTFSDTWTWNGLVWEELDVKGPSARDGARAIFDPMSNVVILFGGAELTPKAKILNDTWLWDGTQWQQVEGSGPFARVHPVLAFDPKRSVIVMTGGSDAPDSILEDTWEWNGEVWVCKSECK